MLLPLKNLKVCGWQQFSSEAADISYILPPIQSTLPALQASSPTQYPAHFLPSFLLHFLWQDEPGSSFSCETILSFAGRTSNMNHDKRKEPLHSEAGLLTSAASPAAEKHPLVLSVQSRKLLHFSQDTQRIFYTIN